MAWHGRLAREFMGETPMPHPFLKKLVPRAYFRLFPLLVAKL